MNPNAVCQNINGRKIAQIRCVKNDTLDDIKIKESCFLMLIVYEGTAYFQVGKRSFEAIAPCFVCFDEREQPILIEKRGLKCDAVYFHPTFLNINMTFDRVHDNSYEQLALRHDMFLLKPFTDEKRFVFPLFEEYTDNLKSLFSRMENELQEQRDWYWSCRSRSFFMEMILMLERSHGIIKQDDSEASMNKIKNPHLKKAVIYIESHYQENITLESITKAVSINHSTLTQLFKEELDMTPIEYLWYYRIVVAKKHLEFTSLPVKDIAVRCGFKTVQHFSRKFEAYTNKTPTAFRNIAIAERKADFN